MGEDTFAHAATLLGVELRGIEILFVQGGTKRMDVIGHRRRMGTERHVEAVYEVDELLLREALEQGTACLPQAVPSHVGHFVGMLGGHKALHLFVEDAQTIIEGPIRRDQIFARITKVNRKGKMISNGDFWWEFFEKVWIRMVPLRPVIMKFYSVVSGRRNS